jgi:uncharacterized protein (TIGR03086 family)
MDGVETVPMIDLEPAGRTVARLLDGIREEQLPHPTPCADTPVAALLDHLMGLSLAFTWAARKSTATEAGGEQVGPGLARAENLDPTWRSLLPERLEELVQAWREESAWQGMTEAGGLAMPAELAAVVTLDELVLHGWDLARATGQPFSCDSGHAAIVLDFVARSAQPDQAALREGLFGPVVDVPDDAPLFDRVLGLAGRDPAWTPERAGTPDRAGTPEPGSAAAPEAADVVRRLFAGYLAGDREAAEQLIAPDFVFTSPQDDRIDRATYFDKCFPTASRLRSQEIRRLAVTGDDVFVMYEYELETGGVHRNAELLTVRDGRLVEAQVFFGGRYD